MTRDLQLLSSTLAGVLIALAASCTQRDAKNSSRDRVDPVSSTLEGCNLGASIPSEPDAGRPRVLYTEPSAVSVKTESQNLGAKVPSDALDEGSAARPLEKAQSGCRILAIGDSLTDPQSHGGGFLKPWVAHCPACQVTNIAKGGAMVNQMVSQLKRHLAESTETYSHWVVFGGVNDLYSDLTAKRTLSRIEHDLSTIYALGHARRSAVIAISVAPWSAFRRWYTEERGANTAKLNQWMREQKMSGAIDFFVDSTPPLTCGNTNELCKELAKPFNDGLHFGPEGHRKLGAVLLEALADKACGT